ncbi:hypothetical protein [Gordonia sp. NPDC003585]|uniref:hypothetical protein n=1 Tax=unclassified Gordonia (in: high G+C Gram-positive bacteria) TaxID=2657482 RepID=UPI00339F089C
MPSQSSELLSADRSARRELAEAVDELHAAEIAAGTRSPVSRVWWVAVVGGVVVAVALAAVMVTAWVRTSDHYTDADFESAAAERVSVLLSPNHRDPQQVWRILSGATGAFYDEFAQSADAYTAFVRAHGTVTHSSVDGTGVAGRADDTASVLVAATVTFDRASAKPDPRAEAVRRFRLRVLVTPADGELKLAAVQYLP